MAAPPKPRRVTRRRTSGRCLGTSGSLLADRAGTQAGEAAVDRERGAGDAGGQRRGEVGDGRGDLLRGDRPTHGVSAVPGFTQLTRTPSRRWSVAMARVSAYTAPLVAL